MWFPVALLHVLTGSALSVINKQQMKRISPLTVLFVNQVVSIALMFILILGTNGIPHVTVRFFLLMICASLLDMAAFIASYFAVRHSDVSLLSPLSALTPLLATLFGLIFLHEIPTPVKLSGILTIVLGVYLLNVSTIKGGIFKPLEKLFSDYGVRLYLITVSIFGITPVFQKLAIFQTSPTTPLFAGFFGNVLVTLYLCMYFLKRQVQNRAEIKGNFRLFILFGLANAIGQFTAYYTFAHAHIGYATAIFSLTSLFTIMSGGVLFKERHIGERMLGAAVMIAGTILLGM